MTPQTELEINGTFFAHPFAELVAEIMQARLNGSLRGEQKDKKWVIYFKKGKIVFAVSNARNTKLFDILLRRNRLTKRDLAGAANLSNDFELAAFLEDKKLLTKSDCDQLFAEQIQAIIVDILSWKDGGWTFSSLTRIRDGLAFEMNARQLLIEYARCLPVGTVLGRFRSLDETFMRSGAPTEDVNLGVDEAFVLSRAEETPLTAADLVRHAAMTESRAFHAIYTLWAGGFLLRKDWRPAFSGNHIAAMKGARLELKREAKLPHTFKTIVDTPVVESKTDVAVPQEYEIAISVEDYLAQVENAETYYDILGVDFDAQIKDLKRAYFKLARNFHPDRFHAEGGEKLKRIQQAFTELAQAHETLKNEASRESYDYRIRKELEEREKHRAAGTEVNVQLEQAVQHFERGFSLLVEGDVERALPFLARAVHFDPNSARYHAYYGKALSADEKKRHKAEAEMQAAIRIDQNDPTFRMLLAEFFIEKNLLKRAEGELNRLLAISPNNREARELLDSLRAGV